MDRRERISDPEEWVRVALDGRQAKIWTCLPGIIQSYNPAHQTVVVQPSVKIGIIGRDGSVTPTTMPLCVDVPVQFPSGGGVTLTFVPAEGDECLLHFACRCIDAWWQSGGIQQQAEFRMHDLSDGFAALGYRSVPRVLSGVSSTSAQLRSDDGTTYVDLNPTGQVVKIVAPGGIDLVGPVAVTGTMMVSGDVVWNVATAATSAMTHEHANSGGTGVGGPPVAGS